MNEGHEHSLPGRFAVFSAKNGKPDVVARFEDDDVWLTQEHLARLYNTSKQNVSQHLKSIFESGELDAETKVKKFFTMGKKEGQVAERPIYHYCLDAIIALGYRIDSPVAIRFRQWATERLHELIQKGFALDHMGTVPAARKGKMDGKWFQIYLKFGHLEPIEASAVKRPHNHVDATPSSRQKRMTTWGLSPLPISRVRSSSSRKNARWATRLIR